MWIIEVHNTRCQQLDMDKKVGEIKKGRRLGYVSRGSKQWIFAKERGRLCIVGLTTSQCELLVIGLKCSFGWMRGWSGSDCVIGFDVCLIQQKLDCLRLLRCVRQTRGLRGVDWNWRRHLIAWEERMGECNEVLNSNIYLLVDAEDRWSGDQRMQRLYSQ